MLPTEEAPTGCSFGERAEGVGPAVFVLRCTKKLLGRIEGQTAAEREPPKSTSRMGDWTANLLIARRQQVVLAVNNVTLLPVLLPLAPAKTFLPRFKEAVGEMLMALGIDRRKALAEMAAMHECILTGTNDRRVLGTMNDFGRMLDFYLDGRSLAEVSLHLAEAPCSPLAMGRPRDAARELFAAPKAVGI